MSYSLNFVWDENIALSIDQRAQLKNFGTELKAIVNLYYSDFDEFALMDNNTNTVNETEFNELEKQSKEFYKMCFENTLRRLAIYCMEQALKIKIRIKKNEQLICEFPNNYIYTIDYYYKKILN
jgi:hypothetical protein